ncbi:hypothetical protein NNX13_07290 [Pseudomonas sp. Eb3]|uniref:hypothetical protein n=1 Tax=Pseudomonas TaxID=286 RepID=UPI0015F9EE8F|nr:MULTISPECIES: hypothetical protein [Pseudomonas]MBA6134836.1 hypothetical protein [Pseudomonas juntendi]MCQ1989666.1 hypothetical protein [Pseudomonas sp. Eb3]
MSHQFKPGDLALIIRGPNSGICVDLISFHLGGTVHFASGRWTEADVPCWLVKGSGLRAGFDDGYVPVEEGLIEPEYLMPLRGDFSPEQQKAKEAEPCA